MLRSYRLRLFISFLSLVIISLGLFLGLLLGQFNRYIYKLQSDLILARLKNVTNLLDFNTTPLSPETQSALHSSSREMSAALLVLYSDNRPRFAVLDGYAPGREDLQRAWAALENRLTSQHTAPALTEDLIFVNLPIQTRETTLQIGALASTISGWRHFLDALFGAGLPVFFLAVLLTFLLARSISRPVTRLILAARRVSQGIYNDPPLPDSSDELGHLTSAFNHMRFQIRQAQQSQRNFLMGVSHDLKTPLSIISGYASALEDGIAEDETARQRALVGIRREAERMSSLIAALLELSRLEAGLAPFKPQVLDMVSLARQVLTAPSDQAKAKNIRLLDELPDELPFIHADANQMERMLANLVDNALRFTPEGGAVAIGARVEAKWLCLWVQDNGPGIPNQQLERIFERFYQAEPGHPAGRTGSGLGLAIVREIAHRHNGEVIAENPPGGGARFIIRLPL